MGWCVVFYKAVTWYFVPLCQFLFFHFSENLQQKWESTCLHIGANARQMVTWLL